MPTTKSLAQALWGGTTQAKGHQVYPIRMTIRSICLRVLLSLGMILNGSSLAMASAHAGMGMGNPLHSASEAAPVLGSQPSCHEDAAHVDATASHDASVKSDSGEPSKSQSPGCCKSGKCSCACVHAAAALPGIARMEATVFHGSILGSVEVSHTAPVLPELSRPPIL